jgi:aminomethyltransferase
MKSKHIGFDCSFENHSNDFSLLALQGPKAFEILKPVLNELPDLEYYSVFETKLGTKPLILARTGYTGEDGFEIFGDHQTIKDLWTKLMAQGATPCGLAARDVLRLEVCYPLYGHELNDEVNPYDAGLAWTVKKHYKTGHLSIS